MHLSGTDLTVFFSVGSCFTTVRRALFDIILCTTLGAVPGVHDQLIETLQSRFEVIRWAKLSMRHHLSMHARIV